MDCICIHFKALYRRHKYRNQYNKNYDHIDSTDHEYEIDNLIDHPYDSDIELINNLEYHDTPTNHVDTNHVDTNHVDTNHVDTNLLITLDHIHTDDDDLSDDLYSCSSGENSPIVFEENIPIDNIPIDNIPIVTSVNDETMKLFIESMVND